MFFAYWILLVIMYFEGFPYGFLWVSGDFSFRALVLRGFLEIPLDDFCLRISGWQV